MDARINELMANGRIVVLEPQVRALEEMLHDATYGGSEGGTLGAYNKTPVQSEMDAYILDIKDGLLQHFEIEPEDGKSEHDVALDYVFDCADDLAEEGELPEFPDDDASDEEVIAWLNAAKSMGFAQYCADNAEEGETGAAGADEEVDESLEVQEAAKRHVAGEEISEALVQKVKAFLKKRDAEADIQFRAGGGGEHNWRSSARSFATER
jgi:hypothetical protein